MRALRFAVPLLDASPARDREHGWNHESGDPFAALTGAGLRVDRLLEYDYSPYDVVANLVLGVDGGYRSRDAVGLVPILLAVEASLPVAR